MRADGTDVALVQALLLDAGGNVVPVSNVKKFMVKMEVVSGDGVFVGGGNGDPSDLTNDKDSVRNAWHGKMMGIFKSTRSLGGGEGGGNIVVKVSCDGLKTETIEIAIIE